LSKIAEATNKIPLKKPDRLIKLSEGCTPWFTTTAEYSTMYHELPRAARFWSVLLAIDHDLAETARKNACHCGGRLHAANYLRKPRGTLEQLPQPQCLRLSFCCDRDGCRKRVTPPSVRFLGPKVYLGVIVILISAMRQGPTPRRVRELSQRFGADHQTIARWQALWRDHFPQTPFWKAERARLVPLVEIVALPLSLVEAFLARHHRCRGWTLLLRFLSPITIPGALQIKVTQ
jgi:hypothetical protein